MLIDFLLLQCVQESPLIFRYTYFACFEKSHMFVLKITKKSPWEICKIL